AANSFAVSNMYYTAGLYQDDAVTSLEGLQSAGMKVCLDDQSETQKGTNILPFPDLEPVQICNGVPSCYNDTVLERLDEFMLLAHNHSIKVTLDMNSFNAICIAEFYTNTSAQAHFHARLVYVLNHVHTTLGKPWRELNEYIFGFEAENEAMIGDGEIFIQEHQQWSCDRAMTIKTELTAAHQILVITGGESWMAEPVQPGFLSCPALDVISIHAYAVTDFYTSSVAGYVQQAIAAGKKLLMEEWGAWYYNTANNDCPSGDALPTSMRNANIQGCAANITAAGLPWLCWEVIPNADSHWGGDFEASVVDDPSWSTLQDACLQDAALSALGAPAAFDFSRYLL
ncbi:hypothetical protein FOMPIDRAFT_53253, partial [Fomitopsis schrenkii]